MATVRELTGGTGDVNPQILTASVTQTAADTTTTLEIPIPIARFQQKKGKSIVFEILKIDYHFGDIVTPGGQVRVGGFFTTAVPPAVNIVLDTTCFSAYEIDGLFSTAVGFAYSKRGPWTDVLNDGAAHGFLVAVDNIFLTVTSANTSVANRVTAKIFYRFKEVALEEYLGIVSGQQ